MRITLTRQWTDIPYKVGTLDNNSSEPIEIARKNENDGILVYPNTHFKIKEVEMKIRRIRDDNYNPPTVSVVDFMDSTGGADSDGRADAATNVSTPEEIREMFK